MSPPVARGSSTHRPGLTRDVGAGLPETLLFYRNTLLTATYLLLPDPDISLLEVHRELSGPAQRGTPFDLPLYLYDCHGV